MYLNLNHARSLAWFESCSSSGKRSLRTKHFTNNELQFDLDGRGPPTNHIEVHHAVIFGANVLHSFKLDNVDASDVRVGVIRTLKQPFGLEQLRCSGNGSVQR